MDEQLTPDEQSVIDQLRTTPRPQISPSAAARIHQQMVSEFRSPAQPPQVRTFPTRRLIVQLILPLAAAVVVIGILASQLFNRTPAGTPASTSQAAILPTLTAEPSQTPTLEIPTATFTALAFPTLWTAVASIPSVVATGSPVVEASATNTPEVMPTLRAIPSPTSEPILIIEGTITGINGNIMQVNGFDVQVAPNHPILKMVEVGDSVRVEGELSASGTVIPDVVSNLPESTTASADAAVGLDGPVDAIDGNIVTVNGIPVQFTPDDPILQNLQVGNFVSIQGNFSVSGTTIVLVVVNVTIFNDITIINNTCWFDPGMGMGMGMGHWHCDGMGMGEPAMGMEDPGMGG